MSYEKNEGKAGEMGRRGFLFTGAAAVATLALRSRYHVLPVEAKGALPKEVTIVEFSEAGAKESAVKVPTVVKTDAQWKQQLTPVAYQVTRQEGTERPYTGPNWNNHDKGLYRCVCCDTALFSSDTKFDSGTGWPSFWQVLAKENVLETADGSLGMMRTAVACRRCNAHLGHVFDDGPRPTGLRYCMNGVSMKFVKA